MLDTDILESLKNSNFKEVSTRDIDQFISNIGFKSFALGIAQPLKEGVIEPLSSFNSEYLEIFNEKQFYLNCPVIQHCNMSDIPQSWHHLLKRNRFSKSVHEIYATSADFGITQGLSVPVYTQMGRAVMSLQFDGKQKELDKYIQHALLNIMGLCQAVMFKLVDQSPHKVTLLPKLTPKEEECLKYLVGGYSNNDISKSMAVSVNRVKELVSSLCVKFNAYNRTELAILGLRNNFI